MSTNFMTYDAEVSGCENRILEKLKLRFSKYMLYVNKYTFSNMMYGELTPSSEHWCKFPYGCVLGTIS